MKHVPQAHLPRTTAMWNSVDFLEPILEIHPKKSDLLKISAVEILLRISMRAFAHSLAL